MEANKVSSVREIRENVENGEIAHPVSVGANIHLIENLDSIINPSFCPQPTNKLPRYSACSPEAALSSFAR